MNSYPHTRLNDDNEYKRSELIRKIEHAIEHMSLKELEALSYDMLHCSCILYRANNVPNVFPAFSIRQYILL